MPFRRTPVRSLQVRNGLALLALLLSLCGGSQGQTQSKTQSTNPPSATHVTHVLGFPGVRHNDKGDIQILGDSVQFQGDGSPAAQVKISAIQKISVEDEEKQVGGTAMMLGKAAAPYGGGRVVSLFAHKKYDLFTVEFMDDSGGLHGAIFQLGKGQGRALKKNLIASGAHISSTDDRAFTQGAPEVKHENK
jgi:hypothetical protein